MLTAGTRLGPYEIVGSLGAGGMGEVYRARDSRLQRDVAIKVLPQSFATDPDRLARFSREAQVLASLNHPHIAHVYGIEESAGTRGLVMELVEGPTLADRMSAGPIPIDEALAIARQIADALDAAHERGIVHRDLKPANIKLTPDGTVKVLDFGLAKMLSPAGTESRDFSPGLASAEAKASALRTLTTPAMTQAGVIMGTAAYMSPEQARGKTVDKRADIWAFGVILYEMLTGRPMFAADTVSDTIAAVLTREPDLNALPASTPASVRHVLSRTLRKDATRRYHSIADARLDLEDSPATAPPSSPSSRTRWATVMTGVFAGLGIASIVFWIAITSRTPATATMAAFTIPNAGFHGVSTTAISRDGKQIAFAPSATAPPFTLYLRALDSFETREVRVIGSGAVINPFFSPDGKWLAFFDANRLMKVPTSGGTPQPLLNIAPGFAQGTWLEDGTIVLSANFAVDNVQRRPLARVSSAGGALSLVTTPVVNESHIDPRSLPVPKRCCLRC